MSHTCTLAGETFSADFTLRPARSAEDRDLTVALHTHARRDLVVSTPSLIATADLRRLREYLTDHLRALAANPDAESFVFTPMELGFQLQASSGEMRGDDDGECTVRLMVQVATGDDLPRLYVGCESVVTAAALRSFIAQLEAVAA